MKVDRSQERATVGVTFQVSRLPGTFTHWGENLEMAKKLAPTFDTTQLEGTVEERVAALNSLLDEKLGVEGKTAIHGVAATLLQARYGLDAVQQVFNSGRLYF